MSLKDTIISDLETIADDLANPVVTWKGEDYECIPSSNGINEVLEIGGFAVTADIIFTIRKELFANDVYPSNQQKITYNSTTYRIEIVRHDVTGAFIRLFCVDADRGI